MLKHRNFRLQQLVQLGHPWVKVVQVLKNGLDGSLKIEGKYEQSQNSKETFELKLKVDPGTQVNIVIKGEGYLTNGVAAHYRFLD